MFKYFFKAEEELHSLEKRFSQVERDLREAHEVYEGTNKKLEEKEAAVRAVTIVININDLLILKTILTTYSLNKWSQVSPGESSS